MTNYDLRIPQGRRCVGLARFAVTAALALGLALPTLQARAGAPSAGRAALLTAYDGAKGDVFGVGLAVSADGKTLLVGSPYKTVHGVGQSGAVYFYARSSAGAWSHAKEVVDPYPGRSYGEGSWFGYSIALSADGDTAVIGAPHACIPITCTDTLHGEEGAVYVYTRTGAAWTQTAALSDPAKTYRDNFGMAVSLSGDGAHLLVGAPGEHTVGGGAAAYVFSRSGSQWTATGTFTPSDPKNDPTYSFGSVVAISRQGTLAAVGAPHTKVRSNLDQGAAYIYTNADGAWSQATTLTAAAGAKDDEYGTAVAVAQSAGGSMALIGAIGIATPCPCANPAGKSGSVYVYSKLGQAWTKTAELQDPAHTSWDGFGERIALSADGSRALIGACFTYWWTAPDAAGRAYLFTHNGGVWNMSRRFTNPNNGERDYYGSQLALDDTASTLFIAASGYPGDTTLNAAQGSVYIYG